MIVLYVEYLYFLIKIQATCYPGDGARYIRHLDSPNGSRKLTCLFYLNKDWGPQWGGVLRAYVDIEDSDECK